MASKHLRVAVIGAGNMGRHHVRNYHSLGQAELVAVADVNPAAKDLASQFDAKYYADYRQMLDEMKPDAVSVVVPTPLHAEVGTEVLRRGIHLLLEKPIASSLEEADELIRLADANKLVFAVGHIERYNPVVRKLKSLIEDGAIGEVISVVCKRVGGFPAIEPKTDVISDLAIHDIDIISYLIGRHPVSVASHGSRTVHSSAFDSAELLLDYGRASGFIQSNWVTPIKIRTIAVTGTSGYVEGNYVTQKLVLSQHNLGPVRPGPKFESFVQEVGEPKQQEISVDFHEPLALELTAFLETIRGRRERALVSPKDAREALKVALDAVAQQQHNLARHSK